MSDRERSFWAWGWADAFPDESARQALAMQVGALLGRSFSPRPLPSLESVRLAAPRVLPPEALAPFSSAEAEDRILHTYGKSYRDVVRAYRGDFSVAPDWVCYPRSEEDIERLLAHCAAEGVAVIPFGGGTSVVGGVEAAVGDGPRGVVSLDLRRLDRVLEVEPVSRSARIQAGATGPVLEEQLAPHGLTLRHFPQSFEFSTLGGWIATRAGGHFATLYTHIDDLVSSVRMITPAGVWASRRLPASGAGPSPDRLALGSEGILGVITEAWVRLQARPRYRASASVTFAHFKDGVRACRMLAQSGLYPSNCRLLDKTDALLGGVFVDGEAVLLLAFESADHPLGPSMDRALALTAEAGGVCPEGPVLREDRGDGAGAQATYKKSFFRAPYLQSALVSLGVLADTFETACTWDRFEELDGAVHDAVLSAMQRALGGGVLARRFTHVYPDGPAPYYTFLAPAREGHELEAWAAIKDAASRAILASGGTITHHHAVGRVHRPYWQSERPEPFAAALRAAKRAVDPAGIMNPGALFEPDER
ncbi:FAD-binding oxidoreductase [Polyangium spumosum]|uniref:FAD-binding protein n=1 Tax=Polyangium spumosum TaxID=889282 RepID=A0A6N7PYT7_9BACT|nr:FAD-binding oxidoreductase [Polyangium spumosum]MRG95640.1 FAD-binding protein [Polyangium spumosum]